MSLRQFRAEIGTHGSGALRPPQERTCLTSPYDINYDQYLNDIGVSLFGNARPDNWQELKARLARRRSSLSDSRFSEEDFQTLKNVNNMAVKKADAVADLLPIIKGNMAIASCHKRILQNLKPLHDELAVAMPDYYEGSLPADLNLRVLNDLGEYIMPSKEWNTPILPNFFLEISGHDGSAVILRRQVSRDLVYGARGMLEIQSYSNGGRRYDNNAYTVGSFYNSGFGILRFYTMYLTQPVDSTEKPKYQMIEIKSFTLTDNVETCREGIEWFRNSREFAKEVRYAAIASANKMAHDRHEGRSSSTSTNHPPISSSTSGVAGLTPGSWLGGPSTSQAPESLTTQDLASRSSESGHGKLERPDAESMLGWSMFVPW